MDSDYGDYRVIVSAPLMTDMIRADGREHRTAWVPVVDPQPHQTGRPLATEQTRLIKASFGLTFVELTQVLVHRAIADGTGKGRKRELLHTEIQQEIHSELLAPWSAATLVDAAKDAADELSPYPTFKAFKDAARDRVRKRKANLDERQSTENWIVEQRRVLRALAIAGFQDQCITSESYKLGDALRRRDDDNCWSGREAMLEERLLLDTGRQGKSCLSLPEMVQVAIYGHINPAELWRNYYLSSPMFDAARCAGWCRIGKVGRLREDGALWLYHYLTGRSCFASYDPDAVSDHLGCRDLIINAFNGLAMVNLNFLCRELLREVTAGLRLGGPIEIHSPAIFAKQRAG